MYKTAVGVLFFGLLLTFGNAQGPLDQLLQNPLLLQLMSQQSSNQNTAAANPGNAGNSASSGMDPMTMAMIMGANGGGFGGMDLQTMALMSSLGGRGMDMNSAPSTPVNGGNTAHNEQTSKELSMLRNAIMQIQKQLSQTVPGAEQQGKGQGKASKVIGINQNLPPNKMFEFMKTGVGVDAKIAKMLCPKKACPFPLPCDNPVITYLPETFFVCPNCPQCPKQAMSGALSSYNNVARG